MTRAALHQQLRRVLLADATPSAIGAGFAVGVFVACTPFFGFHLVLALAVATVFRLNKLAVALGTQVSLPPVIPVLVFASANLGEFVLHGRWLALDWARLVAMPPRALVEAFGLPWLVGSLFVGTALAIPAGVIVTMVARRYRANGTHVERSETASDDRE